MVPDRFAASKDFAFVGRKNSWSVFRNASPTSGMPFSSSGWLLMRLQAYYNPIMNRDPRIDAYLRRKKPFARPILTRLRAVIRAGAPDAVETMKWGMPAFTRRGRILCG